MFGLERLGTKAGTTVMKMEFFASESNSDDDAEDSEHVGSWTPFDTIPSWRPELSAMPKYPLLTPLPDAPWINNQPYYLTHFLNSLVSIVKMYIGVDLIISGHVRMVP